MPVILTTDEGERCGCARRWTRRRALQRALSDDALKVVARGAEKEGKAAA
jgi:hypothetical protein